MENNEVLPVKTATSFDYPTFQHPDPVVNTQYNVAKTIIGEVGGMRDPQTRREAMKMVASSIFNTFGKGEWKKYQTLEEHMDARYYAPRDGVTMIDGKPKNIMAHHAMYGHFDKLDDNMVKDALQIASAAMNGRLKSEYKAQFYFTPGEIENLKKNKGFDFSKVEDTGDVAGYKTFAYKQPTKKSKSN